MSETSRQNFDGGTVVPTPRNCKRTPPRSQQGTSDENHRHDSRDECAHARLGRLRGQQDVLRAEPADRADRGAAHRHRAACRHPFRRRDACHRQPQGRHGEPAARLSLQPRRGGRHLQAHARLGGDHAGDDRKRRRRHPRGRHPHPAHRLAQALRGPVAAGPGALLLLPPGPEPRDAATGCSRRRSSGGAWTPAPATTP